MTENTSALTADNLRADFLNATTNWERWNVLNRALAWATAASENGTHLRQQIATLQRALAAADGRDDAANEWTWRQEP